jgi:hypothetical protein
LFSAVCAAVVVFLLSGFVAAFLLLTPVGVCNVYTSLSRHTLCLCELFLIYIFNLLLKK